MKIINIVKSQNIFKLETYWAGFFEALQMFKSASGKELQKGNGNIMPIYRAGLSLYNEGLEQIEELKNSNSSKEEEKIINLSELTIKKAENFKRKLG